MGNGRGQVIATEKGLRGAIICPGGVLKKGLGDGKGIMSEEMAVAIVQNWRRTRTLGLK
jgi:hypothetical protein